MSTPEIVPETATHIPPIVLVADADAARGERHATYFESSGFWVAVQPEPGSVLDDVLDLKPDAIVTAVQFEGQPRGRDIVHALKSRTDTRDIPIVLLGQNAPGARSTEKADLCLEPRTDPDVVLRSLRELMRSRELRERSEHVRERAGNLIDRSARLIARAGDIAERVDQTRRICPGCGRALEWIERGRIAGEEYDYYHWCSNGCGLYCFNRSGGRWVKLAG
jgi:CheY-like chemotaxis protein